MAKAEWQINTRARGMRAHWEAYLSMNFLPHSCQPPPREQLAVVWKYSVATLEQRESTHSVSFIGDEACAARACAVSPIAATPARTMRVIRRNDEAALGGGWGVEKTQPERIATVEWHAT